MPPDTRKTVLQLKTSAATPASGAPNTVAKETGSQVFDFDPIVSGEYSLTAYEDAMQMNTSQVLAAFE